MSAIAEFWLLDETKLEALKKAAAPKRTLLGKPKDRFWEFLAKEAKTLEEYQWSGYVMSPLLVYLQEQGVDLLKSENDDISNFLCHARGASFFFLTRDHRERLLAKLNPDNYALDDLARYYIEFTEADDEHERASCGRSMLDGIKVIHNNLQRIGDGKVILLGIV